MVSPSVCGGLPAPASPAAPRASPLPTSSSSNSSSAARGELIVHPSFWHTLPAEPIKLSFWEACDDALLANIAARLDARALTMLSLTNRRCRHIAENDDLWRALVLDKFCPAATLGPGVPWRALYRFNVESFRWLAQTAADAIMKLGIRTNAHGGLLTPLGTQLAA